MTRLARISIFGVLVACLGSLQPAWAQQPDAQRTKEELSRLLDHYPPSLRNVLALDPALAANQAYIAPYPELAALLKAHPEIERNPSFYFGEADFAFRPDKRDLNERVVDVWEHMLAGLALLTGFAMVVGLVIWLIRTLVNFKRWSRLAKVQTDAHTKILDRFTANEDLLAYIQSPAGSKFLQSSPIMLDEGPRVMGAPLNRILWSLQGGVVLIAAGIGLLAVSSQVTDISAPPLHALGVLAIALGIGFLISAIISYVISQRLGLIEPMSRSPRAELPGR